MEQFWTYVIWEDDNGKEEEIHNSIIVSMPLEGPVPYDTHLFHYENAQWQRFFMSHY